MAERQGWFARWRERRRARTRNRIFEAYMRVVDADNRGLKTRALFEMPGVVTVNVDRGFTTYVDVTMADGFTINKHGGCPGALNAAAAAVCDRLREREEATHG